MIRMRYLFFLQFLILLGCKTVVNEEPAMESGHYSIASSVSEERYKLDVQEVDSLQYSLFCSGESQYCWGLEHIQGKTFYIKSIAKAAYMSLQKIEDDSYRISFSHQQAEDCEWILQEFMGNRFKLINKEHRLCLKLSGSYTDIMRPVDFMIQNSTEHEFWLFSECN